MRRFSKVPIIVEVWPIFVDGGSSLKSGYI